ncbi:MAG: TonB-dependent receptor family protein [Pseudomonadales bacterium]
MMSARSSIRSLCLVTTSFWLIGTHELASATESSTRITELEIVSVLGERDRTADLPGSHDVLDAEELLELHVMTTSEALRKAAGINVRDEEGFGLRPNIGLRGLNPTRSTKMLLLEDGIPLAYAPYGDNASYYHPPIDRFDRIEILKGAAVNEYGPQTVGGVINYITPTPANDPAGMLRITGGNRDYTNLHGRVGGYGLQLDIIDKRGDGARDNVHSTLQDVNLKYLREIAPDQTLIARLNRYQESSDLTYSGITDTELARFGYRYNPFDNDTFDTERHGASFTHRWQASDRATLTSNVYYSNFARDWWRQSSTTTDSQCNATTYQIDGAPQNFQSARALGFAVDPDDCNSRQGRLRDYESYGIEPTFAYRHTLFGAESTTTLGLRAHREIQQRRQINGTQPTSKSGTRVEDNKRDTRAFAGYLENRFEIDRLSITPGLRLEHIANDRRNAITGADGEATLSEWLPSLGLSYTLADRVQLFAGVHKGFAPPRNEDLIDNSGFATDVDVEESVNLELGVRAQLNAGTSLDITLFRNDFKNQIAVGSIAGGSTPLAEGKALYQGVEVTAYAGADAIADLHWVPYAQVAYTWLPTADIESEFRRVDSGAVIPGATSGNRLPYAPEHLLTARAGARSQSGVDFHVELVLVDDQYADFANTESASVNGNGQIGEISSYHIWNVALNWQVPGMPLTVFTTVKNVADENYIVDRTRGILTAPPRLVQGGFEIRF